MTPTVNFTYSCHGYKRKTHFCCVSFCQCFNGKSSSTLLQTSLDSAVYEMHCFNRRGVFKCLKPYSLSRPYITIKECRKQAAYDNLPN